MAADRQYAHQLIERLEAIQLPTAVRLLEFVFSTLLPNRWR